MNDFPADPVWAPPARPGGGRSRHAKGVRSASAWSRLWADVRARPHVVPVAILFTSFLLLPPEARVMIGGLNFPSFRFAALAFVGWGIFTFGTQKVRFGLVDVLVLVSSLWTAAAFLVVYDGTSRAIPAALSNWLDIAGAYIIGRASIRKPDDLRLLLRLLIVPLLIAAVPLLFESVSGQYIVRPAFARYLGNISQYSGGEIVGTETFATIEYRLGGLLRAPGVFSHPIMAGSILTTMTALYLRSSLDWKLVLLGLISALLGFFSMSSSAAISLVIAFSMIAADLFLKRVSASSWWVVSGLAILAAMIVQIGSQNGLINVLIRMTFDPQTAYYRLLIWTFGSEAAWANPWFGIGYAEYSRPRSILPSGSVDAHYLALALSNGLTACFAMLAAHVAAIVRLATVVSAGRGRDRDLLFALVVALFILLFLSMTVTFFQEARIWFMAWLGIAASLASLKPRMAANREVPPRRHHDRQGARPEGAQQPT